MIICRNCKSTDGTTSGFCHRCLSKASEIILGLGLRYRELQVDLAPSMAITSEISSGAVDAPLPIRGDVEALMHDIYRFFMFAVPFVAKMNDLSSASFARLSRGEVVRKGCLLVANHLSLLNDPDDIRDIADVAFGIDRKVRRIIGLDRIWETRQMPCPMAKCGAHELGTWIGSGVIECRSCGFRCTMDEYTMYVLTFVPPGRR